MSHWGILEKVPTNLGQPGVIIPQYYANVGHTTATWSGNGQYRGSRVYLPSSLVITKVAYRCTTQAKDSGGADDTTPAVDVAIYNSAGTSKLFSTGALTNQTYVAGTTTGFTTSTTAWGSTGIKTIGLASTWTLSPNTVYYAVIWYGTGAVGGTRATFVAGIGSSYSLWGDTMGTAETAAATPGGSAAPATISANAGSTAPIIALRTD